MNNLINTGKHWLHTHQSAAVFGSITLALLLLLVAWRIGSKVARRLSGLSGRLGQSVRNARAKGAENRPRWRVEDVLTALIALTATTYAGTGNWQFLSKATHYGTDLKIVLVWVFEGAVVVEGLRARRNILQYGEPGIDGRGLWVFASASSVLSVSEASSVPEAMARLMVPLIAAFLWERLMKAPLDAEAMAAAKKRRDAVAELTGETKPKRRISWRIRPERIVVWLGLADSADTTTLAAESNRRIMHYVKAAERSDRANAGDKKRRLPWTAAAREARAERKLTAHGLLSYADPTEVYERLSRQKMTATLKRLGVDDEAPTQADPDQAAAELMAAVDERLAGFAAELAKLSTPAQVDTPRLAEADGVYTIHTSFTPDAYTTPTGVSPSADGGDTRVDTGADSTHTRFTPDADKVDSGFDALFGSVVIPSQVTGVDSERIHLGATDADDTLNGHQVDMSTSVNPAPVGVWFSAPDSEGDTTVDMPDDEIRALMDEVDDFEDEDEPEVDTTTGNRQPADVASAIIFAGWSKGARASEIAQQAGRSRSFVYKQFKKLDQKHGARFRDDTTEIPVVTANGTALHDQGEGSAS